MIKIDLDEKLKRAKMPYTASRYRKICIIGSFFIALIFGAFGFILYINQGIPIIFSIGLFFISFILTYQLLMLIPHFKIENRKAMLESDLLYSTRHLLIKLESGSSLINSIESVSNLKTKSSVFFKEIIFDVSLGMPIERAIEKSIEYSPSKAYNKILEELNSSMKTGTDILKSLKSSIDTITKEHLVQIEEYGKKLNPMSMFYMIFGTMLPSLGTAMLVVASSFIGKGLVIDIRILLSIAFLVLIVQIFFLLAFRSLKPSVME